ncbi:hypothetical protein MU582_16615 [Nocardioidaceae bacterium SCSIO 66511]|nr:hypothetical protein MU582_16615 [Nocardioidaceae bacterium SCSIO 66511]
MDETTDRQPAPDETPYSQDRVLLVWQWIFGCAAAATLVLAAIVSTAEPTLTYEDLEPTGETVQIECRSTGQGFAGQRLSRPSTSGYSYEVTSGEGAYDAWEQQEAERFSGTAQAFNPSDGIDTACASAATKRLEVTVWILMLAVVLGICLASVSFVRLRDGSKRPDFAPTETYADQTPTVTDQQNDDDEAQQP